MCVEGASSRKHLQQAQISVHGSVMGLWVAEETLEEEGAGLGCSGTGMSMEIGPGNSWLCRAVNRTG